MSQSLASNTHRLPIQPPKSPLSHCAPQYPFQQNKRLLDRVQVCPRPDVLHRQLSRMIATRWLHLAIWVQILAPKRLHHLNHGEAVQHHAAIRQQPHGKYQPCGETIQCYWHQSLIRKTYSPCRLGLIPRAISIQQRLPGIMLSKSRGYPHGKQTHLGIHSLRNHVLYRGWREVRWFLSRLGKQLRVRWLLN